MYWKYLLYSMRQGGKLKNYDPRDLSQSRNPEDKKDFDGEAEALILEFQDVISLRVCMRES